MGRVWVLWYYGTVCPVLYGTVCNVCIALYGRDMGTSMGMGILYLVWMGVDGSMGVQHHHQGSTPTSQS